MTHSVILIFVQFLCWH